MILSAEVLNGTLMPDGTLKLDSSPSLAPGRVRVTLQSQPPSNSSAPGWWEILQGIWAEQAASGYQPRTREQIDAELNELRAELDERLDRLEQLRNGGKNEPHSQDDGRC